MTAYVGSSAQSYVSTGAVTYQLPHPPFPRTGDLTYLLTTSFVAWSTMPNLLDSVVPALVVSDEPIRAMANNSLKRIHKPESLYESCTILSLGRLKRSGLP
ncbi:hypothetical protein SAMN05444166_7042 [Singulisphaera sp. GP187]|nr:hypothetical protein SAMN05444166_7042 [Singulisphaera sp. GP187]